MINYTKYRSLYLAISSLVLIPGIYSLATQGLKLSIDFTGGTIGEYRFTTDVSKDQISSALDQNSIEVQNIEGQGSEYLLRLPPLSADQSNSLQTALETITGESPLELRFETLGPTLGEELLQKTLVALLLASVLILSYIAYAFKNLKFGICATVATLHDTLVLLGIFSILGAKFGIEVDSLFVTALLTVLSFSVHDTIVVFDRIRETQRKSKGMSQNEIINKAINETMTRSINNSLTIIFMLAALLVFGGSTIRNFVLALLIGTVSGTYSSPFVATQLLPLWDKIFKK